MIAISVYTREKSSQFLGSALAVVSPDNSGRIIKALRENIFPEERFSDIMYMKKAKDTFEKLRGINLKIMPTGRA